MSSVNRVTVSLAAALVSGALLVACTPDGEPTPEVTVTTTTAPTATSPLPTPSEAVSASETVETSVVASPSLSESPGVVDGRMMSATRSGKTIIGMDVLEGWTVYGAEGGLSVFDLIGAKRGGSGQEGDKFETIIVIDALANIPASEVADIAYDLAIADSEYLSNFVKIEPVTIGGLVFVGWEADGNDQFGPYREQYLYRNVDDSVLHIWVHSAGPAPLNADLIAFRDSLTFEPV